MGRVIPSGRVMAARVVLLRESGDEPAVAPASYDEVIATTIGPFPAREFRRQDERLFVVQRLATATVNGTKVWLVVVWTPAVTRDTAAAFLALAADLGADVVRSWAIAVDDDGCLTVAALDADNTAIGTGAKSLWPAQWRKRLAGDGATPSGARIIGNVLA